MSDYDVSVEPFIKWLEKRLKRGKRDAIDNFAKRILADSRLPRQASKNLYEAYLRANGYSADDIQTFLNACQAFRNEQLKESE